MKATAREWIEKAEADFLSAGREYRARKRPNFDAACLAVGVLDDADVAAATRSMKAAHLPVIGAARAKACPP